MRTTDNDGTVALITASAALRERVGDVSAAAGLRLAAGGDADALPLRDCRAVLIGVDAAPGLARGRLGERLEGIVVGEDGNLPELWRWAGELGGLGAVALPSGSAWLVQRLITAKRPPTEECVVAAVFGAAGGVGASTLSAGLAVTAAAAELRPLLIDAHPGPAGVELLLSDEQVMDHWTRFAGIRGFLDPDALCDLPVWEGVRCLGWGGGTEAPLWRGALGSVLAAAGRDHGLAVLDAGDAATGWAELPRRTRAVLVVPASWRGVAAGRARLSLLADAFDHRPLVVLRDVGGRSDPRGWRKHFPDGEVLNLGFDPSIIDDEDSGRPPGSRTRSPLARFSRQLLAALAHPAAAA